MGTDNCCELGRKGIVFFFIVFQFLFFENNSHTSKLPIFFVILFFVILEKSSIFLDIILIRSKLRNNFKT